MKEIRRVAKMEIKGLELSCSWDMEPMWHPVWEPLWNAVEDEGMPPGHLPGRSYLAIPVVSRSGEVIGGLFFGHSQPGVFTQRDERIVTGIAAQAAIAIDNARLFEASQRELAARRHLGRHLDTFSPGDD